MIFFNTPQELSLIREAEKEMLNKARLAREKKAKTLKRVPFQQVTGSLKNGNGRIFKIEEEMLRETEKRFAMKFVQPFIR